MQYITHLKPFSTILFRNVERDLSLKKGLNKIGGVEGNDQLREIWWKKVFQRKSQSCWCDPLNMTPPSRHRDCNNTNFLIQTIIAAGMWKFIQKLLTITMGQMMCIGSEFLSCATRCVNRINLQMGIFWNCADLCTLSLFVKDFHECALIVLFGLRPPPHIS